MRKFLLLLLIAGVGYYLYTHQIYPLPQLWRKPAVLTGTELKEPFAWKTFSRNNAKDPFKVTVEIMDGSRWRIEVKDQGSPKILVAVSDGLTAVSNSRSRVSADTLDPHNLANIVLTLAANNAAVLQKISPQVTEQLDGHTCWRTDVSFNKALVRLWIDAHSHFPVCLDGNITGEHLEFHCSALNLDFARRSSEFFDTHSTQPLFTNYLGQ